MAPAEEFDGLENSKCKNIKIMYDRLQVVLFSHEPETINLNATTDFLDS